MVFICFYFYSFVFFFLQALGFQEIFAAAAIKDRILEIAQPEFVLTLIACIPLNAFSASARKDLDSSRSADCLVFEEDEFLDEWSDDNHGNLYCADDF